MNYNIKDIPNIIDLALKKRVHHVHIISLMPAGRAKRIYKELDPSLEEWMKMDHLLVKIANQVKGKLSLDCGNRRYLPPNLNFSKKNYSEVDKEFAGCPAGKTKAEIDCFGDVYGCDILKDKSLLVGNVRERSFREIWNYSKIFKKWRNRTPKTILGKCKKCKWFFACVGGCPAMSLSEECDIYSSDPSCPGPH